MTVVISPALFVILVLFMRHDFPNSYYRLRHDSFFVDKSHLIQEFFKNSVPRKVFILAIRPKRMGQSTSMNTMSYFFELAYKLMSDPLNMSTIDKLAHVNP